MWRISYTGASRTLGTTYGLHTDQLWILITPKIRKPFIEKSSSRLSPRTPFICGGCHKDITDDKDVFTDKKYDP